MKRFTRLGCGYLKNLNEYKKIHTRLFSVSVAQSGPNLQLEWETSARETIFNNIVNQQKRSYAPISKTVAKECWNCQKEHSEECDIVCRQCGHLQDVNMDVNYFKLLDFPAKFDLELQALTKRFRQLQTIVHPDKFSNKCSREQTNSADWSSLINKAYKTLSIPIKRGQYLLQLHGLQIPQDNSTLNNEFLMEMMERNEEVEEATTKTDLNTINERLNKEIEEKVNTLTKVFAANDLEKAKLLLVEMKYLLSIQKTVKNKLQALMGG